MGDHPEIIDLAANDYMQRPQTQNTEQPDGDIEILITDRQAKNSAKAVVGDRVTSVSHPRIMTANRPSFCVFYLLTQAASVRLRPSMWSNPHHHPAIELPQAAISLLWSSETQKNAVWTYGRLLVLSTYLTGLYAVFGIPAKNSHNTAASSTMDDLGDALSDKPVGMLGGDNWRAFRNISQLRIANIILQTGGETRRRKQQQLLQAPRRCRAEWRDDRATTQAPTRIRLEPDRRQYRVTNSSQKRVFYLFNLFGSRIQAFRRHIAERRSICLPLAWMHRLLRRAYRGRRAAFLSAQNRKRRTAEGEAGFFKYRARGLWRTGNLRIKAGKIGAICCSRPTNR